MRQVIECVPNFSEGRSPETIKAITDEIASVDGVKLLDVDPGKATNRTVVTFVGHPDAVIEAAFLGIKRASELIDMSKHEGEHPRMGATDVCPLIPIDGITMDETVAYAKKLAERVGKELGIPVYLYEEAASREERKNLANIRAGEYEALARKMKDPDFAPDFGPAQFNARSGATVIGARDFLVAYNVNLNTSSVRRANAIAFDVREKGRIKRIGNPVTGEIVRDDSGEPVRIPGKLRSVKAIGWYIEEYKLAQVSMNLTNISKCSLHEAFEACRDSANARGMRVTGSELVGLVPKKVLLDAGKFYLSRQQRSLGISEEELIHIAIKSMGLDELGPFDPKKKIIEYLLEVDNKRNLIGKSLTAFANETASESPAPGGGSISAYVGALGAALGTMVANLSSHKRGWDEKWERYSKVAEEGQSIVDKLLWLVDEDTNAFNKILEAMRMPKGSDEEKALRSQFISEATKYAIEVPLDVMKTAASAIPLLKDMAQHGLKASVSDAGVGALCVYTAVHGAFLNVQINCAGFKDQDFVSVKLNEGQEVLNMTANARDEILKMVEESI